MYSVKSINKHQINQFSSISADAERARRMAEFIKQEINEKRCFLRWCFVIKKYGAMSGRVFYISFNPDHSEVEMMGFYVKPEQDIIKTGTHLLKQSFRKMAKDTAKTVEARLYPEKDPLYKKKQALFNTVGLPLCQEKYRFIRRIHTPPHSSGRLTFKPMDRTGEKLFLEVFQKVTQNTLDREDLFSIRHFGPEKAAEDYFNTLKRIDWAPHRWELGFEQNGEIVGLIIPQTFSLHDGAINYIGVVPEKRGNGYVKDLIHRSLTTLSGIGVKNVYADIDTKNTPIKNALIRAGFELTEQFQVYKKVLQ